MTDTSTSSAATALSPLPEPSADSREFWDGCARGELLMQRCAACRRMRFFPRPMCPHCQSTDAEWAPVSGSGTLYSWIVCHPPLLPAFQARAPYAVILVELAEDPGLRMVGNLLDWPLEEIRIGLPLRVCFEPVGEGVVLPQWRVDQEKLP